MDEKPRITVNRFADPDPSIFDPVRRLSIASSDNSPHSRRNWNVSSEWPLHRMQWQKYIHSRCYSDALRDLCPMLQMEKSRISPLVRERASATQRSAIDTFKNTKMFPTSMHIWPMKSAQFLCPTEHGLKNGVISFFSGIDISTIRRQWRTGFFETRFHHDTDRSLG